MRIDQYALFFEVSRTELMCTNSMTLSLLPLTELPVAGKLQYVTGGLPAIPTAEDQQISSPTVCAYMCVTVAWWLEEGVGPCGPVNGGAN